MKRLTTLAPLLLRAARGPATGLGPALASTLPALLAAQQSSFSVASTATAEQFRGYVDRMYPWPSGMVEEHELPTDVINEEPARKYINLADKELWHEAWMYEDRFGTEDEPIMVPSIEPDRIIGVSDPDDDTVVVWGILQEGDPPRQLIEGGEFYQIKRVSYVLKVGDVLELMEASKQGKVEIAK